MLLENDTIEVTFEFPQGNGSASGDPALSSAIGRPFKRLIDIGKPPGRINYLFFQPFGGQLRTLGALCHTPGEQVLFYPALVTRRVSWYTVSDKKTELVTRPDEFLDHITLEPDSETWHATILTVQGKKETLIPKRRTRQINRCLIFWFALSVKNPSVLEMTPNRVSLGPFPAPSTDSARRATSMMDARKDAVFRTIELNEKQPISNDQFITFEFYLDRSSRTKLWLRHFLLGRWGRSTPILFPIGVPAAQESPKPVLPFPYRSHDVEIPGFRGCFTISTYRTTGSLTGDAILSGY
jgi:hypothetical protein